MQKQNHDRSSSSLWLWRALALRCPGGSSLKPLLGHGGLRTLPATLTPQPPQRTGLSPPHGAAGATPPHGAQPPCMGLAATLPRRVQLLVVTARGTELRRASRAPPAMQHRAAKPSARLLGVIGSPGPKMLQCCGSFVLWFPHRPRGEKSSTALLRCWRQRAELTGGKFPGRSQMRSGDVAPP